MMAFFRIFLIITLSFTLIACEVFVNANSEIHKSKTNTFIKASERLENVKDLLAINPKLTMYDPTLDLLHIWYERDKAFILDNISERQNPNNIIQSMQTLDLFVRKYLWQDLNFSHYNFIARTWCRILDQEIVQKDSISHDLIYYSLAFMTVKNYKTLTPQIRTDYKKFLFNNNLFFVKSPSIIVPHISLTGSVPLKVINNAWGFNINDEDYYSVTFIGIGTKLRLNYDAVRGASSQDNWFHDIAHAYLSRRFSPKHHLLNQNVSNFRNSIMRDARPEHLGLIELAFFTIFHEFTDLHSCAEDLEKYISQLLFNFNDNVTPSKFFPQNNTIEQYETNVLAAKSLGLKVEGSDIIDQQKSFLNLLHKGLTLLLPYTKNYQGNHDESIKKAKLRKLSEFSQPRRSNYAYKDYIINKPIDNSIYYYNLNTMY